MPNSDGDFVRQCLDGHPEMFRHLVARYEAPLLHHLLAKLRNYDAAAEAAQESMVRAYFALPKLKNAESFAAWLFGIGDRVGHEMQRAARRLSATSVPETAASFPVPETNPARIPDLPLRQAVNSLPEPYREVVLLRFYGGQSCSEISSNLGVSLGTITSRLSRAYLLLRKALHDPER